jgi:hypothetical protein
VLSRTSRNCRPREKLDTRWQPDRVVSERGSVVSLEYASQVTTVSTVSHETSRCASRHL